MIDGPDVPTDGRVDLRPLDAGHDEERAAIVRRAVLDRLVPADSGTDLRTFVRMQRGMMAAAAVLLVIAGALVVSDHRRANDSSLDDVLENWLQSRHVPTNGELLTAYRGYRP